MNSFRKGTIILSALGLVLGSSITPFLEGVFAVDTSLTTYLNNQNYNNLVSDGDFLDINSMSVQSIQNFLASKGSYLASAPSSQLGSGANGRSAAQIIYDAAHATYGAAQGLGIDQSTGTINPKAIMITLQKEQSLITTSTYNERGLNYAMGYGCPDATGCASATHLGFSEQVGWGAWQLRYNILKYDTGRTDACGSKPGNVKTITDWDGARSVYFSNRATTSLFCYTPHTYYGNYNFWKLGIEWFGFGVGSGNPGSINDTSSASGRMYANGKYLVKSFKATDVSVSYNGQVIAGTGSNSWQYELNPDVGTRNYVFSYSNGDAKTITIEKRKNGDINGDSSVNLLDLSLIGGAWGQNVKDDDWTNMNPEADNVINLLDLSIFANSWGK